MYLRSLILHILNHWSSPKWRICWAKHIRSGKTGHWGALTGLLLMRSLGMLFWQSALIISWEIGNHQNCLLHQVSYVLLQQGWHFLHKRLITWQWCIHASEWVGINVAGMELWSWYFFSCCRMTVCLLHVFLLFSVYLLLMVTWACVQHTSLRVEKYSQSFSLLPGRAEGI